MQLSVEELCPYARKAGIQEQVPWKNRSRKIFDHEFLYCWSGKANILINDRHYKIIPGTLILVKPDTAHSYWVDEAQSAGIYWVHFDFVYRNDVCGLQQLLEKGNDILYNAQLPQQDYIRMPIMLDNGFIFPEFLIVERPEEMKNLFGRLLIDYNLHGSLWQLESKILLLEILKMVIFQVGGEKKSIEIDNRNSVQRVIGYIQRNYSRKLPMKELANIAGFSEDHLGKIFKRQVGITVNSYINEFRIAKARQLLLYSDFSIESIAEVTGFSDVFYFSKVIKKHEGVSPAQWRKVNR